MKRSNENRECLACPKKFEIKKKDRLRKYCKSCSKLWWYQRDKLIEEKNNNKQIKF